MPFLALLIAAASQPTAPPCRASQLRLSTNDRNGDFNGMSHAGTELSIRNRGRDCTFSALPRVAFRDARGHLLPAVRQAPVGMHPGPVMRPLRIAGGHRATTDLRWVSGPVFDNSRSVQATSVTVRIGKVVLRAPLRATLYGATGKPVTFDQTPLHAEEGMAAD